MYAFDEVTAYDPEVAEAIEDELGRQRSHLELIASENLVSKAVMSAMGSVLTNKYAEGYPGKRYYGGCEYVDVVEELARERAKKLFGCEYANVQPHSGAQANMASSTMTRSAVWPRSAGRSLLWPEPALMRGKSISNGSGRSPTRWALT